MRKRSEEAKTSLQEGHGIIRMPPDLPDNPEILFQLMRDNTHELRYEAAIKLAKLAVRDNALMRRVIAGIRDTDGVFCNSLYECIRHVDPNQDAEVEDTLLHSFRSANDDESRFAAYALVRHRKYANPAVTRLLEDLSNSEPLLRRMAAGILSDAVSQARRSVPRLVQLLADPHKDVRFAASRSLSVLADDRIIPLFANLTEEKETTAMTGWFVGFTIGEMPHIQTAAFDWVESLRHRKPELADSITTGITAGLAA